MKLVAMTSAALLAATSAFAGNLNYEAAPTAPVITDPMPPVEPAPEGSLGGSAGWVIPVVAIGLIALAVSSSHEDHD